MKFPHSDQLILLELQVMDQELAKVRRRIAAPPTAADVTKLERRVDDVHRELVTARTEGEDLERAVTKAEEELGRVRTRAQRDREMANSGLPPRVQQELQHELTSLARRLGDLEDAELDMMQRQEDLAAAVGRLQGDEQELAERLAQLRTQRDEELRDFTSRRDDLTAKRARTAGEIPAGLVALYERSRNDNGVSAAVIVGSQCQGCQLQLPASEIAELQQLPLDEIAHCEECGCLIVRDAARDATGPGEEPA